MKAVKYLSYGADKSARFFLEHALWAAGETRLLAEDAAARLDTAFPGCFKITDPKPAPPADPAKE